MIDFADGHLKIDGAIATEELVAPRLSERRRRDPAQHLITLTIGPALVVGRRLDMHYPPASKLKSPSYLTTHAGLSRQCRCLTRKHEHSVAGLLDMTNGWKGMAIKSITRGRLNGKHCCGWLRSRRCNADQRYYADHEF